MGFTVNDPGKGVAHGLFEHSADEPEVPIASATPDQVGLMEAYGTHVLPALRQEEAAGA